ncbi:MAG: hypothetical protein AAGB51_13875 [Planctomycetota bacterium]
MLEALERARPRKGETKGIYLLRVPCHIQLDNGKMTGFVVHVRGVTAAGATVLHGGYMHNGTRCSMRLPGLKSEVWGVVSDCRHVKGMLHEFDLQFERSEDTDLSKPQPGVVGLPPDLLTALADELTDLIARLEKGIQDRDFIAVHGAVAGLRDPAANLGFQELSESANRLAQEIRTEGAVGGKAAEVDMLTRDVRRALCSLSGLVS